MKLSMARVSVSSRRSHTSSRMDLRDTVRPLFLNQMTQKLSLHQSEMDGRGLRLQLQSLEIDRFSIERKYLVVFFWR